MQAWWARYSKFVLGALAAVAVVVAGVVFNNRTRSVQEGAAAGKLAEANVYYWQQDYPRALQLAKQNATQYPSTPSGLDAPRPVGEASVWARATKNTNTQ